ncbi:MAG: xanthine dehydrogenase family protein [Rhodospirillaceae bacterium]|jgi:aerobic carbon-monoxide dehydrogenase large subunit|nr:xanthine dehydrogenase family protein [Rhodospirillaceae bacterium]MBT5080193.1 xanthine dehydrogenase family protein [Rhodospirillaceae bacterium]MBT5527108.1 xanthine dehydrogenase family protein [Rhodospirillaceae bacterium]MBT5882004.1 xanthine dehydrogenase family protein [Rhodospirillaceae bacterium]MBT6592007.1 xanthine dehydrogenase family protein [Rhodospirillaceae bacterium]
MEIDARPKMIGARVQRLEDPRLLAGQGRFIDDLNLPRMLHIAFVRSDHAHARILEIDSADAAAKPGVAAIFTAPDIAGLWNPIRATSRMADYHATELPVLAHDKVRYVGEAVVAVVAENRYLAEDAAEQIMVSYEPLGDAIDAIANAKADAPLLHDDAGTNVLAARTFHRGDVDAALAEASVRVSGNFRMHRKTPTAMENRGYVADYDPGRRALTLHSTTQIPGIVRDALVEMLDIPGNRLRVVAPDVGGGFGGKGALYPEEVLVCIIARQLGRPVKWLSDRLEDLMTTNQAFDEHVAAELACDGEGHILGLRAEVIGDVGAYSVYPWTAAIEPVQVVSFLPGPYRVPNYLGRVRAVATSKTPTGAYRGVGRPISTFVMERLMDMAAAKLSLDPLEMRRRNMVQADEFPYKTASGIVWDRAGFMECLDKVASSYESLRRDQTAARAQGRWVGIGLASYAELTGLGSRIAVAPGMPVNTGTETATVRIDSTGAVSAYFGIASQGQGLETTLAQVVAEELGVRVEDVDVIQGDSAAVAHGTGTYASRSTVLAGGAAINAARAVREHVIKAAAHIFEADEGDVDAADGQVFVKGTDRGMSFRELARAVYSEMGRLPKDIRENIELEATRMYDPYFGTTTPASHLAVVEVDPETYQVTVQNYVVAEDCGRVINPLIVDGQVHGGVAQGIGAALMEEVVHDGAGQIQTASLMDYVVPTAAEIPAMQVHHLETVLPDNPGGFRGMGEGGTIGAPAAIANAITDALAPMGIDINELPITPERLFRLIDGK